MIQCIPQVKYGGRSPNFIWAPCHVMCTAALIGPATPPIPSHWDSYPRALLVSKDRRHLFVTPVVDLFAYIVCTDSCGKKVFTEGERKKYS
jgi:hypothetical protein